jgi:hypothetical protein
MPGTLADHAQDEIAAPALGADTAMAPMPADADPLADAPARDLGADRVDVAGDLVTRYARIGDAGKEPLDREGIAVADAAGLHFDPDLARARLG